MGRRKFKGKPTGHRNFSHPDDIAAGTCTRPRSFKREEAEEEIEKVSEEEDMEEEPEKPKGTEGIIEIENPNLAKARNVKAKDVGVEKKTELSRREREEIEKQKAHERYMRLQEQGKTEQARKDLERLALIRQQRAEAAKKREAEKAGFEFETSRSQDRATLPLRQAKEQKKAETRK